MKETVAYMAFDGRLFDNKETCIKYERGMRRMFIDDIIVKKLEGRIITDDACAYPLACVDEDYYYALIRIKNMEDLEKAKLYQSCMPYTSERKFEYNDIGKELLVAIGEDYDICYIYGTIDECVEMYRKALMKFKEN